MRFVSGFAAAIALTLCTTAPAFAQDAAVAVKDGGVFAKGWTGKIDAQEEKAGQVLNNARLDEKGGTLHVASQKAVLDLPKLFRERLLFDTLTGQLAWSQLAALKRGDAFGLRDVPKLLKARRRNPWAGIDGIEQDLSRWFG